MKKETLIELHTSFERSVQTVDEDGAEFWLARDLQELLGYSQWRSFASVIDKAITSCIHSGYEPGDHFERVRRMVDVGSGAQRKIEDIALTRYAC